MQDLINFLSHHPYLTAAAIAVLLLLLLIEFLRASRTIGQVTPTNAIQLINHKNAVVIDIRAKELYQKGHIIDAESMPATDFTQFVKRLEKYKLRPIIIVCTAGVESQKITAHLQKSGYNAYSLAGGMRGWIDAQLPIIKE